MDNNLPDILQYEGAIWSVADLFYAAGIKQSEWPNYMMPFFGLMMLEGRMRKKVAELIKENGLEGETLDESFKELFESQNCGYNEYIVLKGMTLATICANDSSFDQDFSDYLNAFDDDLKTLLGIDCSSKVDKYLNMDNVVKELKGKGILMQVAALWSKIDLAPYSNSDITTLEEHIKRKWADISASTAGEQYTPEDIISLIADIAELKVTVPKGKIIHVYDPTCGGANLLYGVADRLKAKDPKRMIATCGSEYNDALYALAAIESRFRDMSEIKYGNTLTKVPFSDKRFDCVVANPPYGTSWKGFAKEIQNDQRGQFPGGLPGVGDGQLLFLQHILYQLDSKGIAIVVHNGSTLFSGDAGSGESNIRKYIFDHDWVEAIIQMPQQEFFNTGITTYLWILNKNKPTERQNLVALIDGSKGWKPLKKSKGDKRREMSPDDRAAIVAALRDFAPSPICKIFDREHFYYNKQKVFLTEVDDNGDYVQEPIDVVAPYSLKLWETDFNRTNNLSPDDAKRLLAAVKSIDWRTLGAFDIVVDGSRHITWDSPIDTITDSEAGKDTFDVLGNGTLEFSLVKGELKGTKSLCVSVVPYITTDYEIIPHHFDKAANDAEIDAFLKKYIFKPFEKGDNSVGVEVNFNKEFYVPEKLESVEDILKEIKELDKQLKEVEL